ncbi:MAG: XdhC family protein [Bacteroidota bacterium]
MSRKNLYPDLAELIAKEVPCVIATVTETKASTPQKPGSSAIFTVKGLSQGIIGGGQIERAVCRSRL